MFPLIVKTNILTIIANKETPVLMLFKKIFFE